VLARELIACAGPWINDRRGPAGAIAVRAELGTVQVRDLPQPGYGLVLRGADLGAVVAICRQRQLLHTDETSPPGGAARPDTAGHPSAPRA
jgi:hypothetical protein